MATRFFGRRTRKEVSTAVKWEKPILKQMFEGHEDEIWDFVFLHDNVHIVSGSLDGTMRKWNCNTGLLVGEPWRGGRIRALALSPDGKMIACGRDDGSVQRWNTDGEMIAGIWTGHSGWVKSLSWSPSGDHLASGSNDETILIRNAENGKVEVGPITTKQNQVRALAYSPLGDRIASGDKTICIWDTKTDKLVVGPIEGLGNIVTSLVWSSDGTKLYSASDEFARVFNSKSGKLLHRFKHNYVLWSVALSPKHDVLACVGRYGIAQLWDTESLQPLGQPLNQDDKLLVHVSFSPDGHHLAYGGYDKKLTLWSVADIAPQLPAPILPQQSDRESIQQETRPDSPSSSCLDADATGGDGIIEEGNDDPYNNNFFESSRQSLPSASPGSHLPHLFSARSLLNVFSRPHPPADESAPKEPSKRKFFTRRAPSNTSLELATMKANQPVPEGKVGQGKGEQGDDRGSANDLLNASKDKGKQRDEPPTDAQIPPSDDPTHPDDLDSKDNRNLWKRMMHARGKDTSDTNIGPATKRPEVVEVYPVRGFQVIVAMKRKSKKQPLAVTGGVPPAAACASANSSQPGSSSQVVSVQAGSSSHAVVANAAQSSQATGGPSSHTSPSHAVAVNVTQSSPAIGGPSSHASPSHFVTNYHTNQDSDSRSSIEGSCNRFLDRICFPFGHYRDGS